VSADSPKLEARAVGKNFGSLRAVSDVSMKVAQGRSARNRGRHRNRVVRVRTMGRDEPTASQ